MIYIATESTAKRTQYRKKEMSKILTNFEKLPFMEICSESRRGSMNTMQHLPSLHKKCSLCRDVKSEL